MVGREWLGALLARGTRTIGMCLRTAHGSALSLQPHFTGIVQNVIGLGPSKVTLGGRSRCWWA